MDIIHSFIKAYASNPAAQRTLYAIFYGFITFILLIIINEIIERITQVYNRRIKKQ